MMPLVRSDAGERGVDVEALAGACSGGAGTVRLHDRHALDRVALGAQIFVQKDAGWTLVVGGGFNIDELSGEVDGINRHVTPEYVMAREQLVREWNG
jgi:hypothetical protein